MAIPVVVKLLGFLGLGWGLSRVLAPEESKGGSVSAHFVRPENAQFDPGQYMDGNHTANFTPVAPDSDPGNVFFGFQTQPDPIEKRRAASVGDLVTVVLMTDPTQATEGRHPLMLGYFEVTGVHGNDGSFLANTFDLKYRGVANINSDMPKGNGYPFEGLELHGVSPEYLGSVLGKVG